MKKLLTLSMTTLLLLAGCSQNTVTKEDIATELSKVDGITSVEKVEILEEYKEDNYFADAYTLTFKTPIDWNNPSLGYFNQRVFLGYKGKNLINTYYASGYGMANASTSNYFQTTKGHELSQHYDGNFIALEYRFFAESKPDDFSCTGTKYLNYLTSEQGCHDFHNIISKLQPILGGKSIFTGASKGGFTTETMSYFYPDDIDSFVSYVAPLCDGIQDERFYRFAFTEIGDNGFGKEDAAEERELMMSFSKFMLQEETRSMYLGWLEEDLSQPTMSLTGRATYDELWETAVAETNIGTWQYNYSFEIVSQIMEMSESSAEEKLTKEKAGYQYIMHDLDVFGSLNQQDTRIYPYYFQAFTEMGNYCYCFDYLEAAGCHITTTKEKQKDLFIRETLTEEQQNYLSYSPFLRTSLIDHLNTTTKDIVKIIGYNDPWSSVADPETDNPHIHVFKENNCHKSNISGLDAQAQAECWAIIDSLVK